MAQVGIVMGSDSDMPVMAKAADILEELGISYEMTIISAHREPDVFFDYAKTAEEKGFKVIIAGAGMAAHLPGMCAAIFPMPVIGIPMHTTSLGGRDSLYSIVQMPSGIPVATVAINGGANAGLLAAKILATSDDALLAKLKDYSRNLKEQVQAKDARLQEIGYKKYMEENQLETLTGNEHKATYKIVTSSRIDTAALKRNAPDIAERYTKTTETKRFTFA